MAVSFQILARFRALLGVFVNAGLLPGGWLFRRQNFQVRGFEPPAPGERLSVPKRFGFFSRLFRFIPRYFVVEHIEVLCQHLNKALERHLECI